MEPKNCNCDPKCDDCKCEGKIDISVPHFDDEYERESQLAEQSQVGIDPDSYIVAREHLIPGTSAYVDFKNLRDFTEVIDDKFDTEYLPTTDQLSDSRVCDDDLPIDPDGGHKEIQSYVSTNTAFAFTDPEKTNTDPTSDDYQESNKGDVIQSYEKIANPRFTDYIQLEFRTFAPNDFYYFSDRLREVRARIQPTKESLYSLRNTLEYVEKILDIDPTPEVEMQILLRFRQTRTELIRRRDWIVSQIATTESTIADLFNEKAEIEHILSEGHFAEIASLYDAVFVTPPANAVDLMFAVRYVEGMSIGVVIDKSGHKLFTKVDFVAPFDKYDELVAFERLFNDYNLIINQPKETNNGR
jgi:hypothetical protein